MADDPIPEEENIETLEKLALYRRRKVKSKDASKSSSSGSFGKVGSPTVTDLVSSVYKISADDPLPSSEEFSFDNDIPGVIDGDESLPEDSLDLPPGFVQSEMLKSSELRSKALEEI